MAAAAVSSAPPLPSSVPPPSQSQRRTSSGILHNVKRAVFGPGKSTIDDSEFTTAQADFTSLHQLLLTLRTSLSQYNKAALVLTTSARATTQAFADVIKDAARPNPYSSTLLSSTQAHTELADKVEGSGAYTRDLTSVVDEQQTVHRALMTRIDERTRLRTDWLYYCKKIEGLQKEREERQLKGKPEKQTDVEKHERNNAKLSDTGDRYRLYNAELMHDLQTVYLSRLKTYGPCLRQFVSAEKRFSSDFYHCMRSVDREEEEEEDDRGGRGGGRVPDGLSINVSAVAEHRAVVVQAEHSPMIDQHIGSSPVNPFDPFAPSPIGGHTPKNVLRNHMGAHSASSSSSPAVPSSRHTAPEQNGALYPHISYPYDQQNGDGIEAHNAFAASAPMLSPPVQQPPFSFSQPQAAGGPRVDVYSDPFANASANPFDDLDEFAAVATPAQSANNRPSFASFSSASRPSSLPASVPEYQPAPYVPPPVVVTALPESPLSSVVMLDGSQMEASVEDNSDTDEVGEGVDAGEEIEEEQEGIPSAALVTPVPVLSTAPDPAPAPPAAVHPAPPSHSAAAPSILAPPPFGFAAIHSAAAPRSPAPPVRLPASLPPSPPVSRPPAPPSARPTQMPIAVIPPRSPQSAGSDNPFDDD